MTALIATLLDCYFLKEFGCHLLLTSSLISNTNVRRKVLVYWKFLTKESRKYPECSQALYSLQGCLRVKTEVWLHESYFFFWNITFDLESQLLILPRLRKRRYIPALLPFSNFPISKWYSIDLLGRSQKLRLQLEDLPENWQLITHLSLAARKVDTFVCYFRCRKFYYYGRKSHWGATICYQSIA